VLEQQSRVVRSAVQDDLLASEIELRRIIHCIPGLVAILSSAGETLLVNQGVLDYFGRTLEELRGWRYSDAVHPDDLPGIVAACQRAIDEGAPMDWEHRLRRADGVYRWFQLRGLPWHGEGEQPSRWYCLLTDIHDRKVAEEALQRSEAFMLEVQRLSKTGGWRYDPARDLVESSPELLRSHAVQPGEDPSRPSFWFDRIHPEDRPRVQAVWERSFRERTPYRCDYRNVLPDGSVRYQHATSHPVINDAGKVVEYIGASMDMTDHWLAVTELDRASQALRDLQLKLSRAAQVASVGELAASIAHEVNQPLAAVVANAHACLRWLSASPANVPKALEAAERIVKDGKDAGEVVRRVRALFKRTLLEQVELDVNEVIAEVLRLLESYPSRKHVALDTQLDPELPSLYADRVQLQQLVLNLMLNALEALEPVSGRTKQLSIRSSRAARGAIAIQVIDNGVGIDDPDAAFEPFFTTKAEGMGLGLAICRSIAAAHDGTLTVEHNVGFGMTFSVILGISSERGA
jgi:PAS domain S-box-containing protein